MLPTEIWYRATAVDLPADRLPPRPGPSLLRTLRRRIGGGLINLGSFVAAERPVALPHGR
jgi:hypothetical protein